MIHFVTESLSRYEAFEQEINFIFWESVMEEELPQDKSGESSSAMMGQKIRDTVNTLFKTLMAIIDRYVVKFKNVCQRILTSDKGFEVKIRKAIRDNKPLQGVKLVAYEYNDNFLENELNKISNIIPKYIQEMQAEKTEVDEEEDTMENIVLKQMGVPPNVKNVQLYFEYMKENFRKEKQARLFTASKATLYLTKALVYENTRKKVTEKQRMMSHQASIIKGNLNKVLMDKQLPKEVKTRVTRRFKNVTHLFNIYTTFLDFYFQLKIEEFLSYRAVLKKLYHVT